MIGVLVPITARSGERGTAMLVQQRPFNSILSSSKAYYFFKKGKNIVKKGIINIEWSSGITMRALVVHKNSHNIPLIAFQLFWNTSGFLKSIYFQVNYGMFAFDRWNNAAGEDEKKLW